MGDGKMMVDEQKLQYYLGFQEDKRITVVIDCQDLPADTTKISEKVVTRTEIILFAHEARALGWKVDLSNVESELVEAYL